MTARVTHVGGKKKLSDAHRELTAPLTEVGKYLAIAIRTRVQATGMDAQNRPMKAYSGKPPSGANPHRYWVPPGKPHPNTVPAGTMGSTSQGISISSGRFAGWAHYRSYRDYLAALGKLGKPHTFSETGLMWRRLKVHVKSLTLTSLMFFGGRGKRRGGGRNPPNAKVAWYSSRRERLPLLLPSDREIYESGKIFKASVETQLGKDYPIGSVIRAETAALKTQSRLTRTRRQIEKLAR